MATGASTADLAIILIDARKGVLTQTAATPSSARCSASATSCWRQQDGPRRLFDQRDLRPIEADYRAFAKSIGFDDFHADPDLGAGGRQHDRALANMPWYHGPTLMAHLETVARRRRPRQASRSVCRCSGSTAPISISAALPAPSPSGTVKPGDGAVALGPHKHGHAHRHHGWRPREAPSPARRSRSRSPTRSTSARRRHLRRGRTPAEVADQFEAKSCGWRRADAARPPLSGSSSAPRPSPATLDDLKYKVNVNTMEHVAAKTLELNEIGVCNLDSTRRSPSRPMRQPRTRLLHPHRPLHQCHGRAWASSTSRCAARRTSTGRPLDVNKKARAAR
jgi:bifunctional enzyme CysN/CysC